MYDNNTLSDWFSRQPRELFFGQSSGWAKRGKTLDISSTLLASHHQSSLLSLSLFPPPSSHSLTEPLESCALSLISYNNGDSKDTVKDSSRRTGECNRMSTNSSRLIQWKLAHDGDCGATSYPGFNRVKRPYCNGFSKHGRTFHYG